MDQWWVTTNREWNFNTGSRIHAQPALYTIFKKTALHARPSYYTFLSNQPMRNRIMFFLTTKKPFKWRREGWKTVERYDFIEYGYSKPPKASNMLHDQSACIHEYKANTCIHAVILCIHAYLTFYDDLWLISLCETTFKRWTIRGKYQKYLFKFSLVLLPPSPPTITTNNNLP